MGGRGSGGGYAPEMQTKRRWMRSSLSVKRARARRRAASSAASTARLISSGSRPSDVYELVALLEQLRAVKHGGGGETRARVKHGHFVTNYGWSWISVTERQRSLHNGVIGNTQIFNEFPRHQISST